MHGPEVAARATEDATCEQPTTTETPYKSKATGTFAVLQDPKGWNRRLVYQFGGGCGTAHSQGGALGTNVVDDGLLSKGYVVATATATRSRPRATTCSRPRPR